jgi:hypothetical protein
MRNLVPRLLVGAAALGVLLIASGGWARAGEESLGSPTLTAINDAQSRGEITAEQAVLYKVYFIKGSSKLPQAYNLGGDRVRCGTPIIMEAKEKMGSFSQPVRQELTELMVRPTLDSYIDTAHYRIHYSTSGSNIIYLWPNTAYRDSVMAACEYSWNFYHVLHGWQVPPSDGSAGGGNGLIDCYVDQLSGVYGVTYSESPGPNWPNDYTAYFIIDNDYTGFGYTDRTLPMKVTVAHEYHHVVQMGYTVANSWWMENVATFCEDEVYDAIDDNHAYLGLFMMYPYWKQATFNGGFEYGAFLWPTFLKERWSHSLIRDIYVCSATGNIYTCFDTVLGTLGSSHRAALAEWNVWNFYTYGRDDGNHYSEASLYNRYIQFDRQFSTYPQLDQHPNSNPNHLPEATGESVMRFIRDTTSPDNKLTITVDGPNCTGQVVVIAKTAGVQEFTEFYMNLDANGNGSVDVIPWDTMEYAHMMVGMPRECGNGTFDYSFSAVTTQTGAVNEHPPLYTRTVNLEQNVPNPFGPETEIGYSLGAGAAVNLGVFDAAGRQVRTLIHTQQAPGQYSVRWDGRDDAGRVMAPGVYFYRLNAGGAEQVRKMILSQ